MHHITSAIKQGLIDRRMLISIDLVFELVLASINFDELVKTAIGHRGLTSNVLSGPNLTGVLAFEFFTREAVGARDVRFTAACAARCVGFAVDDVLGALASQRQIALLAETTCQEQRHRAHHAYRPNAMRGDGAQKR